MSHEESSTFCSDEEYNITVSTKIKCKEKEKIYQLDQYDLHNDDGKGSVQIMKNFKKSLRNDQPFPKPVFEFELSSSHYCVSFKRLTKCGLMEKFYNVTQTMYHLIQLTKMLVYIGWGCHSRVS